MPEQPSVVRFVGVYDADGTVTGELSYLFRRTFAGAHCALCDITHGRVRERSQWREAREMLPVPFDAYHRNDQPAAVRVAAGDRAPIVVAEFTDGRMELVLDEEALQACGGSPKQLVDQLLAVTSSDRG